MRWFLSILLAVVLQPALASARPRDQPFIYVRGDHDVLMSGDTADVARVRKVLKSGERALWTRTSDGKELVIRDRGTLAELERIWKPAGELAEQLGKLGGAQGKLGAQVGALGALQGTLGAKLATADAAERSAIEREMRELDKQMRAFDKPMRALDQQMRALSPKHEAAQQQAQAGTEALIARAIAAGLAQPL